MKKVKLERELLVPDTDFCIMWKNQKEVCPLLSFRKEPNNEKIVWKCNFFDKDLLSNITAHGIKKVCINKEPNKDNVFTFGIIK